jgi:Flp pilus assembly protein TadD
LLKFSASVAIAFALLAASPAFAQATSDSAENHKPPEMDLESSMSQSDYDQAMRLMKHKHYAEAIPHLQFALADKPQDADILASLALAKRMTGDNDSSLYYDQRALAIEPNHKGVHENMGELDIAKGDLASAQTELATLTTLCPSGCDERDALAKAIAAYTPPAPAAAASPATQGHP